MSTRLTQVLVEALVKPDSNNARLTQVLVEALVRPGEPDVRMTSVMVEVLCSGGSFKLTQLGDQRVTGQPNTGRTSQIGGTETYGCHNQLRLGQIGHSVLIVQPPPEPPVGYGFWVCAADSIGGRLAGTEELLGPGPSIVEYPTTLAKPLTETAAGPVVKQQTPNDPRVRAWIWDHIPTGPGWLPYERLLRRLESLQASTRLAAGLPEWVYVKDDVTSGLRHWREARGTVSDASVNLMTDEFANWSTNRFQNGVVEILDGLGAGQRRSVYSNDQTELTLSSDWDTPPIGAVYRVRMSVNDWIKVRVINVSKQSTARATVEQHLRFEFVVLDTKVDDWG